MINKTTAPNTKQNNKQNNKLFNWANHPAEKATLALIALIGLWNLFLAGRVNLSVDEAHYALYGANLALSYFDHPPLVGWLNAVALLFTSSDFGLRVIPTLLFALSNWLLYKIATRLYSDFSWVGFWSVLLINSAVMFQLLSSAMLPDSPIMVASLFIVWTLLNLRESKNQTSNSLKLWLQIGFWLGIAALAKYTAITLVVSLLLILIIEKRWYWLKDKGLWLAVLLTSIMIMPILIWNQQHDWISILYQLHHGTHNDNWDWTRVLTTQLAQFAVYSPLLYLVGISMMLLPFWKKTHSTAAQSANQLLAVFALPTIVLFAIGSGYEMSLPHWTQLAWLIISPAVVYAIWKNWQKKWVRVSVIVNSLLVGLLSFVLNSQLATPWIPFAKNQNIVQELHGWPEAVATAQKIQTQNPDSLLFAANWTQASRIAWYAYPQAVFVTDNRFDQFDMWFGNPPKGSSGIVIVPSYEKPPKGKPNTAGQFASCLLLETKTIKAHKIEIVSYHFYLCQDFTPPVFSGWVKKLPLENFAINDIVKSQAN